VSLIFERRVAMIGACSGSSLLTPVTSVNGSLSKIKIGSSPLFHQPISWLSDRGKSLIKCASQALRFVDFFFFFFWQVASDPQPFKFHGDDI